MGIYHRGIVKDKVWCIRRMGRGGVEVIREKRELHKAKKKPETGRARKEDCETSEKIAGK